MGGSGGGAKYVEENRGDGRERREKTKEEEMGEEDEKSVGFKRKEGNGGAKEGVLKEENRRVELGCVLKIGERLKASSKYL